jgi:hypothetical protein
MDEEEDILEVGVRRPRPMLTRVLAALVLLAAVGGFVVLHMSHGSRHPAAAPTRSPSAPVFVPPPPSTTYGTATPSAVLPPWPQVDGACGNTAFLPFVTSAPLDQRTGIHALVGDRLRGVDVDTGAVTAVAGLPAGLYASEVATTADGTYALMSTCSGFGVTQATIVQLDGRHGARQVAVGPYADLLSGGEHPWGVIYALDSDKTWLDPLDGHQRITLPTGFAPTGAFGSLVVGSVQIPSTSSTANSQPSTIRVIDPVTGRAVLDLGPATSMTVDNGLIVWLGADCAQCSIYTYDLATGVRSHSSGKISAETSVWSGAVSPDHRVFATIRQRSMPARYDMGHPGNPNEIVLVHLDTGKVDVVPGVVLWSKAFPGMAFSADSRWLAITLDEGTSVRLVVWRPGLSKVLQSPAHLSGLVAYRPPVLASAV